MKKLFLYIILLESIVGFSQTPSFLKTFKDIGGSMDVMQYPDFDTLSRSSFFLSGYYSDGNAPVSDSMNGCGFILKCNSNGNTSWIKKYHLLTYSSYFRSINVLKNKDIIVAGLAYAAPKRNGLLMRCDSNGNVLWAKNFLNQDINKVKQLKNGNIGFVATDSFVVNYGVFSNNGTLLWCKKITDFGVHSFNATDLIENKNGDLLITGYRGGATKWDAFAFLADSLGNKKNDIVMANPITNFAMFNKSCIDKKGGFYIVGTGQGNAFDIAGLVVRTDKNLNIIWYEELIAGGGPNNEFTDVAALDSNNVVILTEPESYGIWAAVKRAGLTFMDSNGVNRRNFLFTPDSNDFFPSKFMFLPSGKIIFMTNYSQKFRYGVTDTLTNGFCGFQNITFTPLIAQQVFTNILNSVNSSMSSYTIPVWVATPTNITDNYYCSGPVTGIKENLEENDIEVFPNPAKGQINFITKTEGKFNLNNPSYIKITDSNGNLVKEFNSQYRMEVINIKVDDLANGIYFAKIEFLNKNAIYKKIVILN